MLSKFCFVILLFFVGVTHAQDTLSLQKALEIALQTNYDITIARNNAQIAANSNFAGAARMLPNVIVGIADSPANSNIRQEFTNGTEIIRDGVTSNLFQANIALNWTLFDGGRMFIAKERLEMLEDAGKQQLTISIQNTLSNVIAAYYQVQSLTEYLEVLQRLEQLSEARYMTTKTSFDAGLADLSELQLAEIDQATRKAEIIQQKMLIENAYRDLNVAMGLPPESEQIVSRNTEELVVGAKADLDERFNQNPELMLAHQETQIALQLEKESKTAMMPVINMTAGYGYNLSQSEAGFSLYNLNYGPSANFGLTLPLFTGQVNKRNYENAKIQRQNAELREKQTQQSLKNTYEKAWATYLAIGEQLKIDSASVARLNDYVGIMKLKYELKQSTVVEYREAQYLFESTNYKMISNAYLQKMAALDLLRLTGGLAARQ